MNKIILTFSFFIAFILSFSHASIPGDGITLNILENEITLNKHVTPDKQKLLEQIKNTNNALDKSTKIINQNANKILKMRKFIRKCEIAKSIIKTTFFMASFMALCFTLFSIWNYNMPENTSPRILASIDNNTNEMDLSSINTTNLERVEIYFLKVGVGYMTYMCNDCSPGNEYYPNLPNFYRCGDCFNHNSFWPSYGCAYPLVSGGKQVGWYEAYYSCLPKGFMQWYTSGFLESTRGINAMIFYVNAYSQKLLEIITKLKEINEFTDSIYDFSKNSFQKIFADIQNINKTMQNSFQNIDKYMNTKIKEKEQANTEKKNFFTSIYFSNKQFCQSWLAYISTVYKDCIKNVKKKGYLQEITFLSFNCYLLITNNFLFHNCFLNE